MYQIRKNNNESNNKDFYVVGSMGHCSSIASGYCLFSKNKTLCIDGDGSLLMHMGNMSTIGNLNINLVHIMLNNNRHESVGGQTTNSKKTNFSEIAKSCNYKKTFSIEKKEELISLLNNKKIIENGPVFIELKINFGSVDNLGRPDNKFINLKENFMNC